MPFDFYSHASCEARRKLISGTVAAISISTHTPLARRDTQENCWAMWILSFLLTRLLRGATSGKTSPTQPNLISTHTPHAGRDITPTSSGTLSAFLLTRPMRGATIISLSRLHIFSISTHTPHAGRDFLRLFWRVLFPDFYSHAPCGARQ